MSVDDLPLLDLFQRLRSHGVSLGVEEYMDVLRALRGGFGVESSGALVHLCCTVWIKSEDEAHLFRRLFEAMLAEQPASPEPVEAPDVSPFPREKAVEPEMEPSPRDMPPAGYADASRLPPPRFHTEVEEPVEVVQAIRHAVREDAPLPGRSRYRLLTEYFPVTKRQMKQGWRYLRRPVRAGPPEELDVDATIDRIGRDGILIEPVLLPRRINQAELMMLLDQDGSMVPFHALSRQLVETARRGGRLRQAGVFYFHDYPQGYLYADPARLEAVDLDRALNAMTERTAVFIVSDAGAARGGLDLDRVERTREFLHTLRQQVRHYAWLNPMPHQRWAHTTAGEVAQIVPMFEMSRHGFDAAVRALQGRYVYGEKLYPWMI